MIGNELLTDNKGWLYCDITDNPISLASIIIPYGYSSHELERGYAHLMEHMFIRSNQDYFNTLESQGIIYNAETQAEKTLFTFVDFNGNVLDNEIENLGNILKAEFRQEDLDIEKKTIAQEYLYRASTCAIEAVNEAIGTQEEIKAFSLKGLSAAREAISKHHKVLYISPAPQRLKRILKASEKQDLTNDWYKHINIENISSDDNSMTIVLKNDIYSELLAYSLNILCMCSFEQGKMEQRKNNDFIEIKLRFNKEKLTAMLKDKKKSFSRYIIYLDTIKVYYQELASCINNIGLDFDAEKCYLSNWEVRLLEDI